MSTTNIEALLTRVAEEPELQSRIENLPQNSQQEFVAQLIPLSKEFGVPVTEEEILRYLASAPAPVASEQELENVSGGAGQPQEMPFAPDRSFSLAFFRR